MAIVDDYAGIAAELRRIQAERASEQAPAGDEQGRLPKWHRMRSTTAGEILYRRLVLRRRI